MRFYHLTLITPEGGRTPLEPEGSPLAALWRIRKAQREASEASVGVVMTAIEKEPGPYRALYRARKTTGGGVEASHDAILGHLPAAQRSAILRAIDAFGGDEPDEHLLAAVIAAALAHGNDIGAPDAIAAVPVTVCGKGCHDPNPRSCTATGRRACHCACHNIRVAGS